MKYDMVVVGGRLAGSTSSIFASKGGLDVLMMKKDRKLVRLFNVLKLQTNNTFNILEMEPSKKNISAQTSSYI